MKSYRAAAVASIAAAAAGLAASAALAGPRPSAPLDAARLEIALDRLAVVGGVLYIAAHPDDENTAFLAWARNGRLLHTTYLSLTRGDGGQNLIGTEQGPLIGLLRTQELLAAREVDGAEQRFTRAVDFGFSRSSAETLTTWDREAVLGDIVWAIRDLRPDVVVTRFPKVDPETHGHHTSSAILAEEAFHAAADPTRFPEQLGGPIRPWQARRLFFNNWRAKPEGRTQDMPALVSIDLGGYSPRLGRAWSEIAAESRSMHKSQGFGSAERRGILLNHFELLAGEALPPSAPAGDLFAGLDLTWARVPGGERVARLLAEARRRYQPARPHEIVEPLARALAELDRLEPSAEVRHKREELVEVLRSAAGLWLEAVAAAPSTSPGSTLEVVTTALNRSPLPLRLDGIEIAGAAPLPTLGPEPLADNVPAVHSWRVEIPAEAPLSHPWWLDPSGQPDRGLGTAPSLRGKPEAAAPLRARFLLTLPGPTPTRLELEQAVAHRATDPVAGERWRPLAVVPPLSLELDARTYVFPDLGPKTVRVKLTRHAGVASGTVRLVLPDGFRGQPAFQTFALARDGEQRWVSFQVTPAAAGASGTLAAVAEGAGATHDRRLVEISHPHIPHQTLTPLAQARLVQVQLEGSRPRIGYIMGPGDEIPEALRQAGYPVTLLDDSALAAGDFSGFDTLVSGVRAWNTREALRPAFPALMAWVEGGGTLVVQYNTHRGLVSDAIAPFPLQLSRDRVTVEGAPVRLIDPTHPLLRHPHAISGRDFEGWVQERGLYFAGSSDPRYQRPLGMADPGQSEQTGSLLYARHGKGVYIYTGLAFFRELPAGVPGAYRLFANLLAAGSARTP